MANFGLIGHPLSHSFSHKYFTEKFKNQGVNNTYLNLDLSDLTNLRQEVKLANLNGFNVTIPYKQSIVPHLDALDKSATEIDAVNCVNITQEGWIGFNTDYIGFMRSLKPYLKEQHKTALILGTGGASYAVAYALNKLGIQYHFASRDRTKGILYSDLINRIDNYQIIINTTPLGTFPETDVCPDIPYQELTKIHLCYDLVYNPQESLFLQKSNQFGAAIKNGLEMLEIQADESWKIWQSNNA